MSVCNLAVANNFMLSSLQYKEVKLLQFCTFVYLLVDYIPSGITTMVTIPASDPDMRTCFTGPIIDDSIALEPDETFSLKIDNISPDNRRINTGIDTTVITIIDDDSESECAN